MHTQMTQPTLATQEPLLALRRQLAGLMADAATAGQCCLHYARLGRKSGHLEAAAAASLEAVARNVPGALSCGA